MADPRLTAMYDQMLAGGRDELDRLEQILTVSTAEVGERQAFANVVAYLARRESVDLAGILAVAVLQISKAKGSPGE